MTDEPGITVHLPAEGVQPLEKTMANEIDATVALAMQQGYAQSHAALTAAGVRHNNAANFITETVQLQHELNRQLVGAKAAARLETDALANSILQQNAARDQPGVNVTAAKP